MYLAVQISDSSSTERFCTSSVACGKSLQSTEFGWSWILKYKSGVWLKFLDVSNSRLWPENRKGETDRGYFCLYMRNWKSHDRRAAIPVFFWKNVDFELRGVEPLIVSKASVNGSRVWWRLFGNILLAHLV